MIYKQSVFEMFLNPGKIFCNYVAMNVQSVRQIF